VEDLLDLTSEDIVFGGLPLFHVFRSNVRASTPSVVAGGVPHPLATLRPVRRRWRFLLAITSTVFEGVPTMYGALVHHPDWAKFRPVGAAVVRGRGGSAMPVEIMRGFEKEFRLQLCWRDTA